ncbi:hypothetical protein CRP01_02410 [Flavilitoribacter nigricans DSM 23189 = NBRC 102662]|uniref:Uncharacterized protein n=1 Tax=Flavilitoribacter nigricans (strain ATCC 23147 / DSM 23189 / NBRC 102662 / NCIMB 1420 / SS-2) TaxID=1122177 RepID=A0A2D0NI64_FLAN2|nr:hypothetical protein CRP01_02410 [Flavilitoribacter nigricans DSM 23189 = NBRC 102662]
MLFGLVIQSGECHTVPGKISRSLAIKKKDVSYRAIPGSNGLEFVIGPPAGRSYQNCGSSSQIPGEKSRLF